MERVMIFIDGSNFYYNIKNVYGIKKSVSDFDFRKLVAFLSQGRTLIRTYYYNAILNQNDDPEKYRRQQKFFERLRAITDFEVITCRMQKDTVNGKTVYSVKEDDIHIAVDLLKLAYANAYDSAILVSNDGDFVPAVQAVKETGKKVENVGFENKFHGI